MTPSTTPAEETAAADMPPVIVWCSRGGLAQTLGQSLLGRPGAEPPQVMPFDAGQPWHELTSGWQDPWGRDGLERALARTLQDRPSLVHAVDTQDPLFHQGLVQVTSSLGYRHVLLHERDAGMRLAHLRPAGLESLPAGQVPLEAMRAWLRREHASLMALARVRQLLRGNQHQRRVQAMEGLLWHGSAAAPSAAQADRWLQLMAFVGRADASPLVWHGLARALVEQRQALVLRLKPHAELLIGEAHWMADLDLNPGFLQARLTTSAGSADSAARLVRLAPWPAWLREGESFQLAGAVVATDSATPVDGGLLLAQGGHTRPLTWGQSSPAIGAQLSDHPQAGAARFKTVTVTASRRLPVELQVRSDPGQAATTVARLGFETVGGPGIDGILLARHGIGYQPIPKVACTSMKEAFFQLGMGHAFSVERAGGERHVHAFFERRMQDISQARRKLLLLRDPIRRFLSGYGNRVIHHKELSRRYISGLRLERPLNLATFPFDPTLEQFVENFELYRRIPTIQHHFRPISEFVAPLSCYDHVYPLEDLARVQADLSEWTGQPVRLPHAQQGGPKISVADVSKRTLHRLIDLYAQDYELLSPLYRPPAAGTDA